MTLIFFTSNGTSTLKSKVIQLFRSLLDYVFNDFQSKINLICILTFNEFRRTADDILLFCHFFKAVHGPCIAYLMGLCEINPEKNMLPFTGSKVYGSVSEILIVRVKSYINNLHSIKLLFSIITYLTFILSIRTESLKITPTKFIYPQRPCLKSNVKQCHVNKSKPIAFTTTTVVMTI